MAEDFVKKGQLLVGGGEYQEAVKVARLGLLANPTSLPGRLVLARALLALGRLDEVLAEVRVVLEIDTTSEDAHCLRAEALIRKGDLAEAELSLRDAERHSPGSPRVVALLKELSEHQLDAGSSTAVSATPSPRLDSTSEIELSSVDMIPLSTGEFEAAPPVSQDEALAQEAFDPPVAPPSAEQPPASPPSVPPLGGGAVPRVAGPSEETVAEAPLRGAMPDAGPVIDPLASTMVGSSAASKPDLAASGEEALGAIAGLEFDEEPPAAGISSDSTAGSTAVTKLGKFATGDEAVAGDRDMRTIRQGLGLSPDPTKLVGAEAAAEGEPLKAAATRKPKKSRSSVKSAARRRASKSRKRRTSRLTMMIYVLLAGGAIAGAIFAGFKVREIRLEQQIRYALTEGRDKAAADTLVGYGRALTSFEGILAVRPNPEAQAANALIASQRTFEFGANLREARDAVSAAAAVQSADELIARVYLALVDYKIEDARKLIAETATKYPREDTRLAYLRGAAYLMEAEYARAAEEFEAALADRRPLPYVRLAECQIELGDYDSALASMDRALELVERHPHAMIVRNRVLARAGRILESNSKAELSEVIAESMRGPADQTIGASKLQASWAALVLAEVGIALGDRDTAIKALTRAAKDRGKVLDPRFSLALIRGLVAVGDVEKASLELQILSAELPEGRLTEIARGTVALAEGRLGDAQAALTAAGDLEGYPAGVALRGVTKLEAGLVDAAIVDLDSALEAVPGLRDANLARARADLLRGDSRAAKRRLEGLFDSLESAPANVIIAYSESIAAAGDRQRARGILSDLSRREDSASVQVALASMHLLDQEIGDATKALDRALELEPGHVVATVTLAELAIDDANRKRAGELLDRLPDSASGRVQVVSIRARLATITGDHARAAELLKGVKEVGAVGPRVDREAGRLALRRGDVGTAVERLQRASKALPNDLEIHLLWLEALLAKEGGTGNSNVDRVIAAIEKQFAGTPEVNLARGMVLVHKKDSGAAVATLSAARSRMKENQRQKRRRADTAYYLGRAHYIAGDLAKATASFNAALGFDSGHARSQFFIGQIQFESENFEEAAAAYSRAVEADPSGVPRAWFYLGDVSSVLGRDKEARKALQTYAERFPKGSDIEAVKRLLGKL